MDRITVGVSPRTFQEIGPPPRPWLQFEIVPGTDAAPEVIWRRQRDRSAWVYEAVLSTPSLRWLHTDTAGVDHLPLETLQKQGILLSNARGAYTVAVSEWVTSSILLIAKRFHVLIRQSDSRIWRPPPGIRELSQEKAVILGLGSIGLAIARQLSAFGMYSVGIVRSPDFDRDAAASADVADVLCSTARWKDTLADASYLIISAPLTKATAGMVDAEALRRLPCHAWVVNVGRGEILDEAALIDALDRGGIAGAVLDTFPREPLDPQSPLWGRENVIISPHSSSFSDQGPSRTRALFLAEAERYRTGRPLRNLVSFEKGY